MESNVYPWFSSAHSRKVAKKLGKEQANVPNSCLSGICSHLFPSLWREPHICKLGFCLFVKLPTLVCLSVYSSRYLALALSPGLDFWMPHLSVRLDRIFWVLICALDSAGHMVTSPPSMVWSFLWLLIILLFPQHLFTRKSPFISPISQQFWELGGRASHFKERNTQAQVQSPFPTSYVYPRLFLTES